MTETKILPAPARGGRPDKAVGGPDPSEAKEPVWRGLRSPNQKRFGVFYFLRSVAEKIGLLPVLAESFPTEWGRLFNIAAFLAATPNSLPFCSFWTDDALTFPGDMSKPAVDGLLSDLDPGLADKFHLLWAESLGEKKCLAADLSSTPPHRALLASEKFAYPRTDDKQPRTGMHMVLGDESLTPVFLAASLGELEEREAGKRTLTGRMFPGRSSLTLVTGGAFDGPDGDRALLKERLRSGNFIAAVPFSNPLAAAQPERHAGSIRTPANLLAAPPGTWAATFGVTLGGNDKARLHVFYNSDKAASDEYLANLKVKNLLELARNNPDDMLHLGEFKKWLDVIKTNAGTVTVRTNMGELKKSLARSGWLVVATSRGIKPEKVLSAHRAQMILELYFRRLASQLDLRVEANTRETLRSKIFLAFLALALISSVDKVLAENSPDPKYSASEAINIFESLIMTRYKVNTVLNDLTPAQHNLLMMFDLDKPILDLPTE
ncbi:MAG: hypothetical protein LBP95_12575 [Deltaproteobacteria bacterium]|jgi:hypothetical protein|nr:hypothetical protein [Deltaproteobacteria bacterium]